jgi:polyhydroxybutyrate depolymerase
MQKDTRRTFHELTLLSASAFFALACAAKPQAPQIAPIAGASGSAASAAAGMSAANTNVIAGAGNGAGHGAGGTVNAAGTFQAPPPTPSDAGSARVIDAGRDSGADDDASTVTDAAVRPARNTGPGDWVAGDYPPDITSSSYREISGVAGQGDNVRQYKVHIPPTYKPDVATPLVFCIHGLGQDAVLFCVTGAAMDTKSDAAGFILVMPNGYDNSWNAGTCCGDASTQQLDDVALFRAIFKEVGQHVNVDLDRVYATGLSNGGYMSYRLACEAADIFTAVAPGAGAIGTNDIGGGDNTTSDFTKCEPSRPVSVLDMHGTEDPLIPYALQAPSLAQMVMKNGCATTPAPALQPKSGGDTTCVSYQDCPSGIEVTGCSVQNGGHCWFGSPDCGTGAGDIGLAIVGANSDTLHDTDAVWDFFSRMSH